MANKKKLSKEEKEKKIQAYKKIAKEVTVTPVEEYVENAYLPFAFSVCLDRALVFVEDGVKPIQRRILWTAYRNHVTDKSPLMKSATFCGRVFAYSPHGDCYLSLINMSAPAVPGQPRNLRVPLVYIKGNAGSLDSGPAACLTKDTKLVACLDLDKPKVKSIEELLNVDLDEYPHYTFSVNSRGKRTSGRIKKVWKSGEEEVLNIHLSNGEVVRATGNHRFLTNNYDEILAKKLKAGQLLATAGRKVFITRIIKGKKEEVYDVEIEGKNHNFLLDANIYVHNSRYTEMKLWPAAMELVKELDEDAVDMIPNYNETDVEPKHLPARWPVAVINGASGLAVGFSCNIPCHNPDEIMDTCIDLVHDPKARLKIKGPDFDCGCDIVACTEREGELVDGIKEYLKTGAGSFIMRGKYHVTESKKGAYTINFTALPYQIGPEKVLDAVKKQYEKGNFKELSSWKDLSDIEVPVNVEFKTKKGVSIAKVINDLFTLTPLQTPYAVNNTIIMDNLPQKMGMREILLSFVEFRRECTRRKLNFRVKKAEDKLHTQEALQAVLLDIDKCISIIRKSDTAEIAKEKLMKAFKIDERQAEYILSIQLRKLTKSDKIEIDKNIDELRKKIDQIKGILNSEKKFNNFVASELEDTKEIISSPRKCKIYKTINDDIEDDVDDVYIQCNGNKVKRTFEKDKDNYKVSDDGRMLIITYKNGADVRSVYELPDGRFAAIGSFSDLSGRAIAGAGAEGYLVLVGINGMMKIVDLSTVELPKGQNIPTILAQPIKDAFVLKEIKGKLLVNDKKEIPLSKLPVFGIKAKGNKVYNKPVKTVQYIKEEK